MSQHIAGFLVNVRILFGPFLIETHVFRQSCTLSRQKQLQSCRCRKRPSLKWPERCRTMSKTAFFLSDGPPTCISQAAKRTGTVPGGLREWERSDFTIFMTAKRTGGRHDGLRRRKRQGGWGLLTAKRTRTVPGGLRGWERSDFTIFLTAKRTGRRHDGLRRRKRQGVWGFLTAKRTGTVPGRLRGMASPAIWLKIAGLVDIAHWRLSAGGIAC